jgi:hypothetical protein
MSLQRTVRPAILLLAVAALAALLPTPAAAEPANPAAKDPFQWRKGNLAWLEPMVVEAIRGERLQVGPGFFDEATRQRARMTPNHEALWRALRYTAAVRGDGGNLATERDQIEAWFERQRREGLQLDEPGGYIQIWGAASALSALAAWEDVAAHPDDDRAEETARAVFGWWRDFGAYYGRLRTDSGMLLRVGARQLHRPRDAAFDEVLVDLLLGPVERGPHANARWMAGKPEHAWMRRGFGAWSAREVMALGVPLDEVAREGLDAPMPRIANRVTVSPGEWAWMPVIHGLGPMRWSSWAENGDIGFTGQGRSHRARRQLATAPEGVRWNLREGLTTGPDAELAPLPELPGAGDGRLRPIRP